MVFDFSDSAIGWRLYDLGVFLFSIRTGISQEQERQDAWSQFIEGYRTQRGLEDELIEQVLLFTALKKLWLLGFHSTMVNRHGDSWLNQSYYEAAFKRLREIARELHLAEPSH